jgi:hypothetical protein
MFTTDFNRRSVGRGGGTFVRAFYHTLFQKLPKYVARFDGLNRKDAENLMGELADEYNDWKRKTETIVTGRNRLFALYHLVRVMLACMRACMRAFVRPADLFMQFGPAVLLDPIFSALKIGKASKVYNRMFVRVSERIKVDAQEYFAEDHEEDEEGQPHFSPALIKNATTLVINVLQILAEDAVVKFAQDFFREFPSTVPDPRP